MEKVVKKMRIVSDVKDQQELDEMKSIMEIYFVNHRIHKYFG